MSKRCSELFLENVENLKKIKKNTIDNYEIILEAIKVNPNIFPYLSEELKNNKELVLEVLKKKRLFFKICIKRITK